MFTPGPWIYEETDDGHMIFMGNAIKNRGCYDAHCQIEYNHMCFYDEGVEDDSPANAQAREAEANARLIAAAPDMYEALNDLVKHANTQPGPVPEELWVQAEKALDKAEGKEETR